MSIGDYIFSLLIEPLKLLLEVVFFYAFKVTDNVGLSIIVMSLVVNFVVLPLYKRADELQAEERDIQAKMADRIKRTKQTFKGDERFMMLKEYYRINHYKPIYALKSSVSLLLQIPFFIAAYSFLSELKLVEGMSLGPVRDLGQPDSLIVLGNISINLLPFIMTAINIISALIYLNKSPIKEKLKLILIALVFLVLLYNSPSALVFYWTLNNLFSLIKNLVLRFKEKKDGIVPTISKAKNWSDMAVVFLAGSVLAILTGVMIPSKIIASNPEEIINVFIPVPHSPLDYLINSALISCGTFLIWVPVFYYLVSGKLGKIISRALVAIASVGVLNSIAFDPDFGFLTSKLVYEKAMSFRVTDILINLAADAAVVAVVIFVGQKISSYKKISVLLLLSVIVFSGTNIAFFLINYHGVNYRVNSYDETKLSMTQTGENVVVIMMDRMIGAYIPFIFAEHPEVKTQFEGFTYYPNTLSYGVATNIASPALFGGYEYTPERLNARSNELLKDKHNEALLVMPTIFSDNDWNVTVCDLPYVDYAWLSDTSAFDGYNGIHAYNLSRSMNSDMLAESGKELEERLNRNFFCYGLMKTMPYIIQPLIYTNGSYTHFYGYSVDENLQGTFIREQMALASLSSVVEISDSSQNCFIAFSNRTTHEVCLLSDERYDGKLVVDGKALYFDDEEDYKSYQCNVQACILLGQWFDYLRENDLYDNTRIIIVADHGYGLCNIDELLLEDIGFDAEWVNPVLLVKDFNQNGFTVSDELMTNADTPFLAMDGVVENPVNPFTGEPIVAEDKSQDQLLYISTEWFTVTNNGTQFKDDKAYWLTVHDNIWNDDNWTKYDLPAEN